MKLHC